MGWGGACQAGLGKGRFGGGARDSGGGAGSEAEKYYLSAKLPNHCLSLKRPFAYLIKDQLLRVSGKVIGQIPHQAVGDVSGLEEINLVISFYSINAPCPRRRRCSTDVDKEPVNAEHLSCHSGDLSPAGAHVPVAQLDSDVKGLYKHGLTRPDPCQRFAALSD